MAGLVGTGIGVGAITAADATAGRTPTATAAPPTTAAVTSLFIMDCPFRMECASGARAQVKLTSADRDATPTKISLWTTHVAVDNQVFCWTEAGISRIRVGWCRVRPP